MCLLHAYKNPVHELSVRDAISERYPNVRVTLSSEVWPEWREFERTYNTTLNAALKPVIEEYLHGLVVAVHETAAEASVQIMHADGGRAQSTRHYATTRSHFAVGDCCGSALRRRQSKERRLSLRRQSRHGRDEHRHRPVRRWPAPTQQRALRRVGGHARVCRHRRGVDWRRRRLDRVVRRGRRAACWADERGGRSGPRLLRSRRDAPHSDRRLPPARLPRS